MTALPSELLARIFADCAPDEDEQDIRSPTGELESLGKTYLLRFALVCRRWRVVAFGTPALWATISLRLDQWRAPILPLATSLLELSLTRSKPHPLDITINCDWLSDEENIAGRAAFAILAACRNRWRSAVLYLSPDLHDFLPSIGGDFPVLENLEGSFPGNFTVSSAPMLRHVVIHGTGTADGLPRLPWSQLSEFYFSTYNARTVLPEELALLPPTCSFEYVANGVDARLTPYLPLTGSFSAFTFALAPDSTDTAEIAVETATTIGRTLDALTLPFLAQFTLHNYNGFVDPPTWNADAFRRFAERSGLPRTLTHLRLHAFLIAAGEIAEAVGLCAALVELSVQDSLPPALEDEYSSAPNGECALVTDELLGMLDVPRTLERLAMYTRVVFDEHEALCGVVERHLKQMQQGLGKMFVLQLAVAVEAQRELDLGVVERLCELEGEQFRFDFRKVTREEMEV